MNLFRSGLFQLSSGKQTSWKIDCDALVDDDWKTLAGMVRLMVPSFRSVVGVPTGGLKLAEHLQPFCTIEGPLLIVDDVLTTGQSMEDMRRAREAVGVVVFARGQCPIWIKSIFQMPEKFWTKPRHR